MDKPVTISFEGTYRMELQKGDDGNYDSVIISKQEKSGYTPVFDFPVKTIQENKEIGLELEFNSEQIFVNA